MDERSTQFPKPTTWYDRLVVWAVTWEDCEGVPLAIGSFRDEGGLRARVAGALHLLAVYAPADLARVRKLMRGIVVTRLYGANAQWRQSIRVCVLSTEYLQSAEAAAEGVAATIVHELTHARLDAIGFDYRKERQARIERICFRASNRFLQKLPESDHRKAALEEIEEFLAFDTGVWRALLGRDDRPWYFRALAYVLRRVT
ncbi:MAG: hypothetical protein H7Z74_14235 [Anaerolineae bacterium]|nr:hypothetical protein [Gemmatimonadaceae bacterium]